MRKLDGFDTIENKPTDITLKSKRKNHHLKLNADLLNKFESQFKNTLKYSIEHKIPSQSYIENVTELNDIENCPEANQIYLEKKYLSPDFLNTNDFNQNNS